MRIETGAIDSCLGRLDPPQAVFIGGGAREPGLIEQVWSALPSTGRLVVNAVSLETEAILLEEHGHRGGSLTRIGIERAEPIGSLTGWRPAMPVVQWAVVKP